MWFNFVTHNHGSLVALEGLAPITDYMRSVLTRCGHEATVSFNELYPDAINVYFEYFPSANFINEILTLKKRGAKIGIIATELIVENQIPYGQHGIIYGGQNDKNDKMNKQRVEGFNALVSEVDFIWTFLERTAISYKNRAKFCEFFPVGYVSGGWTPPPLAAPKDIDVLLFGKSTPHRLSVLNKISEYGIDLSCFGWGFKAGYLPNSLLNSYLDRTKICLNLTLHAEDDTQNGIDPRFVSCMRVKELFDRNICVVSEEIPFDNPYKNYMISSPIDSLGKVLSDILSDRTWQSLGISNAHAFANDMDVLKLCGPIINRTIESLKHK